MELGDDEATQIERFTKVIILFTDERIDRE